MYGRTSYGLGVYGYTPTESEPPPDPPASSGSRTRPLFRTSNYVKSAGVFAATIRIDGTTTVDTTERDDLELVLAGVL